MPIDQRAAQIGTVCEYIDQCFSFTIWCDDFAQHVDPEDILCGLDRGFELMSDATLLYSFISLRRLDDFLKTNRRNRDDLIANDLGIDLQSVFDNQPNDLLTNDERTKVNKQVAHLSDKLSLEGDEEVTLSDILLRSEPIISRLLNGLNDADNSEETSQAIQNTRELVERVNQLLQS